VDGPNFWLLGPPTGLGFRVQGVWCRVWGVRCRV
jgi:hypothetical protein